MCRNSAAIFKLLVRDPLPFAQSLILTRLETNRAKAESDLDQFRSNTSSEASESATLKSRISSLEASNRDALALLESKTNAYERLSQDLSAQHQKASDLRKQVASLEQTAQSSNSAAASAKFREQSLQQEIELLKKNNEWLENERKLKADEHTAFRKEKNARISELSRSNEQYIADAEALKRSEVSLKHRLDEYVNKYEDGQQEIQKLREEKASDAESHRLEIETASRLADLQKSAADAAKQRLEEVQEAAEELREDFANELGALRADAEMDHKEKEAAVSKISELESTITELRSEIQEERNRPSTPHQPVNGNAISTPARPSTPLGIFSPTPRMKSVTQTQAYSEYKRVEKELAKERHEKENLQKELDDMVAQMEEAKPELDEVRTDNSRLHNEVLEMSGLVESATKEREEASRNARLYHSQLDTRIKEVEALQQQLRDLSSQCRRLIMEIDVRDRGQSFTEDDWVNLQREADERSEAEMQGLSETQRVVNQRLIAFKNVAELQQQNQDQLATIRNLVASLESQESVERQEKFVSMEQDIETYKAQIAGFQDEIKTMVAQSKSFVKERDMFRNMLTRKGHLGDITDFSRSLPVPPAGSPSKGGSPSVAGGEGDFAKLLKDMQQQFDNYRQESNLDHSSLRTQVDDLSKRNSELQAQAGRLQGQLSAATQRAEMLQSNYTMLKNENAELQRRSSTAMENATKQEMKVQQAAEDLIQTKGLVDSLQRESANLKAEKDLWKSVEKRLIEDNETLRTDRGRLDQLNGSLQGILNEREQADSENRRRVQMQVESLESELQATKRKLNDEQEDSRKATLRREYEQEQSQKRIDDLLTSQTSTKEELSAAKTSRDHLQARVDELTVELRAAEERLEVYTKPAAQPSDEATQDEGISTEQSLTLEISELKRELDHTKSELERANEQIDVYKNIAQSAEERLQELGETNDQYREETEASIGEKDAKIKDLEQRVEDIGAELENTNNELSKLRDEQTDVNRRLEEQKALLDTEIERLKESEERATEQAQFNLEASKAQAQIATEAQQNYENELVKHADAARNLQTARAEVGELRLSIIDLKTKAETAQQDLEQKEASWSEIKDRYEQELAKVENQKKDALKQNETLHSQLEGLTQQISALQRDRAALNESSTSGDANEPNLEGLQEVIKYLRREKEIVDVQYHLSQQEAKRLRQQLDFVQTQLDETRLKLEQQRRSEADLERNAMSHNKLMETLNELNLFRESSVTLRAEAKQATLALVEKTKQVEALESQIQPLQVRVAELENLVETRDGELKILQNDRDHWRQRTQDILSKYNRIDPAELEGMKEQLGNLEKERDDAVAARDDLQAQVDNIPEQIKEAKAELRTALGEQFKGRSRDLNAKIREKQTEVDTITTEKNAVQQELDEVREQLESARNHQTGHQSDQVNGENAKSPGEIDSGADDRVASLQSKIAELESSVQDKDQRISAGISEKDAAVKAKEDQLKNHLKKKMDEFRAAAEKAKETALQELRTELEASHKQALDNLRAELTVVGSTDNAGAPIESAQPTVSQTAPDDKEDGANNAKVEVSDEALLAVAPERWTWAVKNVQPLRALVMRSIKSNLEKEKAALSAGTASEAQIQQIRTEMEAALNKQQTDFEAQKEALESEYQQRLDKEKEELVSQHQNELEAQKLGFSEESEQKIAEQVQRAEQMMEKKSGLQLKMANNRASAAQAKIKVVETAATETPDRAVGEVWDEAKVAKPPPVPTAPKPAADGAPAATPASTPATAAPSEPTNTTEPTPSQPVDDSKEVADPESTKPAPASTPQTVPNGPAAKPAIATGPAASRGGGRGGSAIPRGGAPRGGSQIASGQRGTGIPRGGARGTGIPRGGARSASTGGQAQRGGVTASPGRGGLNPSASQFVPTGKRPREDGDVGDASQKRIRGGGQGS